MSKTTPTLPPGLTIIEKPVSEVFSGNWVLLSSGIHQVTSRKSDEVGVSLSFASHPRLSGRPGSTAKVLVPDGSLATEQKRRQRLADDWHKAGAYLNDVGIKDKDAVSDMVKEAADIIRADRAEYAERLRSLREELGLTGNEGWHQCFNEIQRVLGLAQALREELAGARQDINTTATERDLLRNEAREARSNLLNVSAERDRLRREVRSLAAGCQRDINRRNTALRDLDECRAKLADAERELERARACGWPKPGEEAGFRGFSEPAGPGVAVSEGVAANAWSFVSQHPGTQASPSLMLTVEGHCPACREVEEAFAVDGEEYDCGGFPVERAPEWTILDVRSQRRGPNTVAWLDRIREEAVNAGANALLLTDEGWECAATLLDVYDGEAGAFGTTLYAWRGVHLFKDSTQPSDAIVIRLTERTSKESIKAAAKKVLGVDVPVVSLDEPPSIPSWDLSPADEAVVGDLHRKSTATKTLDDALDPTTQPGKRDRSAPPPSDTTDHVAARLTPAHLEHARRREVAKQAEERRHHRVLVGGEWACECRVANDQTSLVTLKLQGRNFVVSNDGTKPLLHPALVKQCPICLTRRPWVRS